MYNIPEEGKKAKNRFEAINTELTAAFGTALSKHGGEELFAGPVAAEPIGKFVADSNRPRPV